MREPKIEKPAPLDRAARPTQIEFDVELITPLFGGGAVPREVDRISWLRSAAAKSAIRAWWRAGNAHNFDSIEAMRKQEDTLFGAQARYDEKKNPVGGQGILSVVVEPKRIDVEEYNKAQENPINGAYFPAAVGKPRAKLGKVGETTRITLLFHTRYGREVSANDFEEIMLGVRLWLTLGGAGGRTRRGAGALAISEHVAKELGVPTTTAALESFLSTHCRRRTVHEKLNGVFGLGRSRSVQIRDPFGAATAAHEKLLEPMREARQDRKHPPGRKGREGWGQSRWPEADAIRFKASRNGDGREWVHRPVEGNAKKYPRTALGLPIVIQFHPKDKDKEPKGYEICGALPEGREWRRVDRYASPILLRVVRVWRDGTAQYVPVAIFTDCTLPPDTRPLVMKTESGPLNQSDVVREYSIREHADETLSRVEKKFLDAGFTKLQEKP